MDIMVKIISYSNFSYTMRDESTSDPLTLRDKYEYSCIDIWITGYYIFNVFEKLLLLSRFSQESLYLKIQFSL